MHLLCPTGKEKEVWERRWKILLPGGETRQSLCQEEGDAAAGGGDGHTPATMRPFDTSFWFWLCCSGGWSPGQRADQLLRVVGGIRLPDPSGARQEEVRRGGTCEFWSFPCHVECLNLTKPYSPCSDWPGAGVPPQHFDAQQPDGGDDSGLHALQTRAAAQPAERERPFWERCSPSDVISSNWTSIRF